MPVVSCGLPDRGAWHKMSILATFCGQDTAMQVATRSSVFLINRPGAFVGVARVLTEAEPHEGRTAAVIKVALFVIHYSQFSWRSHHGQGQGAV